MVSPETTIAKRLVFHVGGYDPITPHAGAQRRFMREIERFQLTWSVKATIDGLQQDDVVESYSRRPIYSRIQLGVMAFLDFIRAGALRGYIRTNWQYAGFFLYPFFVFGALLLTAGLAGMLAFKASGSPAVAIVAGFAV